MSAPNPGADDKPRLIVVVPVVLVCLGAIYLLLNISKPARDSSDSAPVSTNASAPHTDAVASNQIIHRSATYRLGPPLRSVSPETQSVEEPIVLDKEREAKTPLPSSERIGSDPAPFGAVLLLDSGIEISGKVTLIGTPPPEIVIDMLSDAACGRLQKNPPATRHYVVGKDGELANVFVHIRTGLNAKNFATLTNTPLLDQVGCSYQPYVMGVMANQKFKIKNSDPTLHNVHAIPSQGDNREFNFAQPIKDTVTERSFPSPEIFVRFRCDIHPWMFAYVAVMEHPFFAVTDTNGLFRLPPGLPPGRYTLEAIHLKAGAVSRETEVRASEKKSVDFTLHVSPTP